MSTVQCKRCNYYGCQLRMREHPTLGHYIWTVEYAIRRLRDRYGYRALRKYIRSKLYGVDISKLQDVQLDGIDLGDWPDFCDAYISHATIDGRDLTDEQLEYLNSNHGDYVHELASERAIDRCADMADYYRDGTIEYE